jgi:hypothetical protein
MRDVTPSASPEQVTIILADPVAWIEIEDVPTSVSDNEAFR